MKLMGFQLFFRISGTWEM